MNCKIYMCSVSKTFLQAVAICFWVSHNLAATNEAGTTHEGGGRTEPSWGNCLPRPLSCSLPHLHSEWDQPCAPWDEEKNSNFHKAKCCHWPHHRWESALITSGIDHFTITTKHNASLFMWMLVVFIDKVIVRFDRAVGTTTIPFDFNVVFPLLHKVIILFTQTWKWISIQNPCSSG